MRLRITFVLSVLVLLGGIAPALAAQRVALVIGNANYQHHDRLRNPRSDAELMAQTFRASRFDSVESVADTDQLALLGALRNFKARAATAELAVIYYSGHGMKHAGERQNYVLPVDMPGLAANASLDPDLVLKSKAVSEAAMLAAMGDAKYQLLILDACRDNGGRGSKSGDKGLTRRVGVGPGRLIAYATEENRTAKDGAGRYSPYAESLARHLSNSRLSIVQALDATAEEVRQATGNAQQPMKSGDLAWDVRLDLARAEGRSADVSVSRPADADAEAAAWALATKAHTSVAYKAYLAAFPTGANRAAADAALKALPPGSGGFVRSDLLALAVSRLPSPISADGGDVFVVSSNGMFASSAYSRVSGVGHLQYDILLHDARGVEVARLVAAKNSITSLNFSPDGSWLAAKDYNENCHLWSTKSFTLLRTLERVRQCRWFAGSSDQLLLNGWFGGLATYTRATGKSREWQRADRHYLLHVTPDGMAITSKEDKLWFWRGGPDAVPTKFDLPKDAVAAFGNRHFYVVTETEIAMVELATLKRVGAVRHGLQTHGDFATFAVRPAADERHLALAMTIGGKSAVQVWQVAGWQRIYEQVLRSSDGLQPSAWSHDSRYFAFNAGYDGTGNNHRVGVLDVARLALGSVEGRLNARPIFAADNRSFSVPSAEFRID